MHLTELADKNMQASEAGQSIGNALYVLRQERELISQEDLMDYLLNYPHCQFLPASSAKSSVEKDPFEMKQQMLSALGERQQSKKKYKWRQANDRFDQQHQDPH